MEDINDRELNIVGERYSSFYEAYRVGDSRRFNRVNGPRGDAQVLNAMEIAPGVSYDYPATRNALLNSSDLFQEQFQEARKESMSILKERYEWRDTLTNGASVFGQNVIVERYMAGHPEAFRRSTSQLRKKRSVYILYDAMCPASTSVDKRIKAGCCVLVAAEVLEKLGYEVKLAYGLAKYSGAPIAQDPTLLLEVELKGYGEPLNLLKTQFPIASKSTLFHLGCWWAHRFPRTPVDYGEGEGFPVSYNKGKVKAMERYALKQGGVYLSEDIVELQLRMDPLKVLLHILGVVDDEDVLESHTRRSTPMDAASQPEQGKIFHSWDPRGEHDEEAEGPEDRSEAPIREPEAEGGNPLEKSQRQGLEPGEPEEKESEQEQPDAKEVGDIGDSQSLSLLPEGGAGMGKGISPHFSGTQRQPEKFPGGEEADLEGDSSAGQDQAQGGSSGSQGDDTQHESSQHHGNDGGEKETDSAEQPKSGDLADRKDPSQDTDLGVGEAPDEEGEGDEEKPRILKADQEKQQVMEDKRESEGMDSGEFIVELRKRFVRFENGEYLNAMIDQKMTRRRAAKEAAAQSDSTAPFAPGYDPNKPPEVGSRAFAAFAFK